MNLDIFWLKDDALEESANLPRYIAKQHENRQPADRKQKKPAFLLGFEVPEAGVEQSPFLQGFTGLSTLPGPTSGPIPIADDSTAGLKTRALEDLQRAWKALRRLEDLADVPAESKAAGRAVAFVDKAFAELEGGKR